MKRFFIYTLICSLTALIGCDKNDEVMNDLATTNGKKVTVTANIQGDAATRVTLTPDTDESENPIVKVDWKASNETFKAYADGVAEPIVFTQTADTEDSKNLFEGTLNGTAPYTLYYGDKEYNLSIQDGTLNEAYVLMQATTDFSTTTIDFAHKTAILKPTFKVGEATLATNTITKIVMGGIKNPTATTESGSITVTPSALGDIYIFLPAFESYTAGHTFTFNVTAGGQDYEATLTIPNGKSIEAGKYYTASLSLTETIPYLTFSAESEQTLDLVQTFYEFDEEYFPYDYPGYGDDTGVIEYSVGNSDDWTKFTPDTTDPVTFGGENGDLRLRGKSSKGTLWAKIVFGTNTSVECSGDIRTLVDWENHKTADTSSATFRGLFSGCSVLNSAPKLPATNLAEYCYKSMFYGCTHLTEAPELPATNLAANCYGQMFNGCTHLTKAPVLKAETLVDGCYNAMFYGCSALNDITMLATDINAIDCLTAWVYGVSATGTFTKAASLMQGTESGQIPTGASGIPSSWTVENYTGL